MNDLRQAAQRALEALEGGADSWQLVGPAIDALRSALVEPDTKADFQATAKLSAGPEEPQCNPHPKAPHGFLRNASHTEDRYVCECEYWDPYQAGYQAGMEAAHGIGDGT